MLNFKLDQAVVIVPRDSLGCFMKSSTKLDDDMPSMVGHLACSLLEKPGDESILEALAENYQGNLEWLKLPSDVMTNLAKASFLSRNWGLFKDVLGEESAQLSVDFFKFAREHLPTESGSFQIIQEE